MFIKIYLNKNQFRTGFAGLDSTCTISSVSNLKENNVYKYMIYKKRFLLLILHCLGVGAEVRKRMKCILIFFLD